MEPQRSTRNMPADLEKPRRLTPQERLRGRLPGVLSLWRRAREGPGGPVAARDLVAVWAGLRRLAAAGADDAQVRLDEVVVADGGALGAALASLVFRADEWIHRVDVLDLAWDSGEIDEEELDWQTYTLF